MIYAYIQGGLGNQLFQYAFARALALRHGTTVGLVVNGYGSDGLSRACNGDLRRMLLDKFAIQASFCTKALGERLELAHWPIWPAKVLRRLGFTGVPGVRRIVDRNWKYSPRYMNARDNTYLQGYWQSERYFAGAADVIRQDLQLRDTTIALPASKILESLRSSGRPIVAVHVRRGDYAYAQANPSARLPVAQFPSSIDYYITAMRRFDPESWFLVFSDSSRDIEWCRSQFRDSNVLFSEGHTELEDFTLMQLCDHNIISNSSFSWWAAWLNATPKRRVVAPLQWFRHDAVLSFTAADIVPSDWEILG